MKKTDIDLSKLQAPTYRPKTPLYSLNLNELFAGKASSYLNDFGTYAAYFNLIPNSIGVSNVDCRKAHHWFLTNHQSKVYDTYYKKDTDIFSKSMDFDSVVHFLEEDLMVNFDYEHSAVHFLFRNTAVAVVNEFIQGVDKFRQRARLSKPSLSVLVNTGRGIGLNTLELAGVKLNIAENYNDDFLEINHRIINRLRRKKDRGLVLLHGKPGTGKTSYIRYLVSKVRKDVIFLPSYMASAITNPDLINVLVENPGSILVIEDAENVIVDREIDSRSPVSALLNISDGLLADCLNIQIICSFNTDISRIDRALMRKGRLIARYEFKELDLTKTRQLSAKLGFKSKLNEPMTLAAIYNQDEEDFRENKTVRSVGFKVSA